MTLPVPQFMKVFCFLLAYHYVSSSVIDYTNWTFPFSSLRDLFISKFAIKYPVQHWVTDFNLWVLPRLQIITMKKERVFFVVSYTFLLISKMKDIPIR